MSEGYDERDASIDGEMQRLADERDAALNIIEKARVILTDVRRSTDNACLNASALLASVDTSALAVRDAEMRLQGRLDGADILAARDAEKWDEGAEAATEYMANPRTASGIPFDPPLNPYKRKKPNGY